MPRKRHSIAFVYLLFFATLGPALSADGEEVVRVYGVPPARMDVLRQHGDLWGRNWREDFVVMLVTPAERESLERLGHVIATDVKETARLAAFRAVDREAWRRSGDGGIPGFPCYRTVDETHATLAELVSDYPQFARLERIGETWQAENNQVEGDIFALVIANQESVHEQAPLVVMAAQHARELTTAETATRFAELLLAERGSVGDIAWLLDHRAIHVVAQQNPDGRRQVEQGETSWRKNHNETACGTGSAPGVDLNRNSSFLWGQHSSTSPCSQTYRGAAASSEPETGAVQDYLEEVYERQRPPDMDTPAPGDTRGIFLSLHSFGRMVLFPWEGLGGQNENNAPNHDELAILGRKLGFHTDYAVARWQLLGPAGGTTVDYAYGELGVAAYTLELGTSFVQTCQSFESTIWPAMREALLYAAKAAERPYQAPWGPDVVVLEAVFDPVGERVEVSAVADGTRYFRGTVTEPPASDPVFDVLEGTASLDLPPHLAEATFALTLDGTGSVVGVSGEIPVADWTGEPRLLFVAASDAGGHTGVPTAVWVEAPSAPVLTFDAASLDFGDVEVGETSPPQSSTIHNSGDADATNLTSSTPGGGFVADASACGGVLPFGASCQVSLTFAPPGAGPSAATLTVESDEGVSADLSLEGNGVGDFLPVLAFEPASVDFGIVDVGGTGSPQVSSLRNTGHGEATMLDFSEPDSGFEADTSACGVSLPAGASCPVTVSFTPGEAGPAAATLHAGSADSASASLSLAGLGLAEGASFTAIALEVDPDGLTSDGNRVLEPGELVVAAPAWQSGETTTKSLEGSAADFTGPDGADYILLLDSARYGDVGPGETASCLGEGVCYQLGITDPAVRPATHWESTFEEILSDGTSKTWTVHIGQSFADVPKASPFYRSIETLLHHDITGGCAAGSVGAAAYCPTAVNTRGQMPVFGLRALEGADYSPSVCVEGEEAFADVPATSGLCPWIQELASRGVVAGCGEGVYCPNDPVNRQQMAIFLVRTIEGPDYTPPACVGVFEDVPCTSPFAAWVEDLFSRDITSGCGSDPRLYCPTDLVNRQQMAVFVAATFGLTLYGP